MKLWLKTMPCWIVTGWLMGGCALMTDGGAKKLPSNMIATPPSYYSTAKGRYLGTKYRENLDRITEKIVRNPGTSQLQFANNISSVGGIGFFTHSATKTTDERYLEVVLATPETFETKGDYSDKLQKLFSRYGQDLLSILAADSEIFQDNDLAGYGLNLNWRTVSGDGQGSRVSMARAVVYFHKGRVASYLRRNIGQNELLGDAVIFAVEDEGPLQLVSYRPDEVKADFRPAIREDNLTTGAPAKAAAKVPAESHKDEPTPPAKTVPAKKGEPVAEKPAAPKAMADKSVAMPSRASAPAASLPMEVMDSAKRDTPPAKELTPATRQRQPSPVVLPNPALTAESVKPVPEIMLPMTSSVMTSAPVVEEHEESKGSVITERAKNGEAHSAESDAEVASRGAEDRPTTAGAMVVESPKSAKSNLPASATAVLQPQSKPHTTAPHKEVRPQVATEPVLPAEPKLSREPERKIAASAPMDPPTETTSAAMKPSVPAEKVQLAEKSAEMEALPSTRARTESAAPRTERISPNENRTSASSGTAPAARPITPKTFEKPVQSAPKVLEVEPARAMTDAHAVASAPVPEIPSPIPSGQPAPSPVQRLESLPVAKTEISRTPPRQQPPDPATAPEARPVEATAPAAELENKEVRVQPSPLNAASKPEWIEKPAGEQLALLRKPVEPTVTRTPAEPPAPRPLHGFIIQVAFRDKHKAQSWAEKMTRRGYAVSLTEAGPEGALRVRLGNFTVRDDAERELQNFKREGMTGIIINLPQAFRPAAQSSLP